MTADELRKYYDEQGRNQLDGMDEAGQQNMFDKFLVSTEYLFKVIKTFDIYGSPGLT